jgi:hypothetical protein
VRANSLLDYNLSATQTVGKLAPLTLETILGIRDRDVFVEEYYGKHFLRAAGWPGKFSSLLSWSALNQILRFHPSLSNRLRLSKEGKIVDAQTFLRYRQGGSFPVISPPDLVAQLRDGATLIIDGIDELHEPILRIAQQLERALSVHIQANMYASWRSSPGFDLHWDDHDVIILQIIGKKRWRVFGHTEKFPIDHMHEAKSKPPEGDPIWNGHLDDGDALYIPRGWWHVVNGCDEPSIHLTVGMSNPTGLKVLQWMTDRLRGDEFLRMDVPRFANAQIQSEYLLTLRKSVLQFLEDPNLLSKFINQLNAMAEPRPAFGLPWSATVDVLPEYEDWVVTVLAPRGLEVERDEGTNVKVTFLGKELTFNEITAPLFECLREDVSMTLSDFYRKFEGEFQREQLVDFLSDLVKHGVIVLSEPS